MKHVKNKYLAHVLLNLVDFCPPPLLFRRWLEAEKAKLKGRLVVDLGSGSGGFLLAEAALKKEDLFIGFEVRSKRLVQSHAKLEQAQLKNVRVLYLDALRLAEFFLPKSVDLVLIQFPDPWPKAKHKQKRLLDSAQLRGALEWVFKTGSKLAIKTDSPIGFLHALETTSHWQNWQVLFFSNHTNRDGFPPSRIATEFQKMFQAQKQNIYSLVLTFKGKTA